MVARSHKRHWSRSLRLYSQPIWRHGGVALVDWQENSPKASRAAKQAICQALSLKNQAKAIQIVTLKATGKTKDTAKQLANLKLQDKFVLAVVPEKTDQLLKSTNNLKQLKVVRATYLNVFDILKADAILFSPEAVEITTNWLTGKEKV